MARRDEVILYHLCFTISVTMIVIYSSKTWLIKKNVEVKCDIIPETNEEYISAIFGCIRFIDIHRFVSSSSDLLVKTLVIADFIILKTKFPDK